MPQQARSAPRRRWLGGKLRSAHAHAAAGILPQLLARMQVAERARDRAEVECGEAFRDVGVISGLPRDRVEDLLRQGGNLDIIAGLARLVRLAGDIVLDPGAL